MIVIPAQAGIQDEREVGSNLYWYSYPAGLKRIPLRSDQICHRCRHSSYFKSK